MEFKHISVLLRESVDALNVKKDGIYADGTLGGGGHSYEIAKLLGKDGLLIGIDRDTDALFAAKKRLAEFDNIRYVHSNFANIKNIMRNIGVSELDGAVIDLGVSSYQLDSDERGFSYMKDAPLDMRMDRSAPFSAYELINTYSEAELMRIFFEYGEEKFSRKIASHIVKEREKRPIETTLELVDIIKSAIPKASIQKGSHPAKRVFQAVRIEVNSELEPLKTAIEDFFDCLKAGGRLSVISFHSLEDRIIKKCFQSFASGCICPKDFPICICGQKPKGKIISTKPILPSSEELEYNKRSKSAKLRICEKL